MYNGIGVEAGPYGRSLDDWDVLAEATEKFLIERARLEKLTSYTELDATLMRRTGLPGFDFSQQADRAAMGHLLGLVVGRNYPVTGVLISALVIYLDGNDPGPGFYAIAQDMQKLSRRADDFAKLEFWSLQVAALHARYHRNRS